MEEKQYLFPNLFKLIRKIFVIQASLAIFKRIFSLEGLIFNSKRSKLKPELVEFIMFIKLNI